MRKINSFSNSTEALLAAQRRLKAQKSERYLRLWRKFKKTRECGKTSLELYRSYGVWKLVDPQFLWDETTDLTDLGAFSRWWSGDWVPPLLCGVPHYDKRDGTITISEEHGGLRRLPIKSLKKLTLDNLLRIVNFTVDVTRDKDVLMGIIAETIENCQRLRKRFGLRLANPFQAKRRKLENKDLAIWFVDALLTSGLNFSAHRIEALIKSLPKSRKTIDAYSKQFREMSDGKKTEIRNSLLVKFNPKKRISISQAEKIYAEPKKTMDHSY